MFDLMIVVDAGVVALVGDYATQSSIRTLKVSDTSNGLHAARRIDHARVPFLYRAHTLDHAYFRFFLVVSHHGRGYNYRGTEHVAQAV